MQRDACSRQFRRREVMRLLGAGAGLGVLSEFWPGADQAAASFQRAAAGARTLRLPQGAIIRTVLKDIDPNSITGMTLFHEHFDQTVRAPGAPVELPSDDVNWMVEEIKATAKAGVSCLVDSGPGGPRAPRTWQGLEFLKQVSQQTGIHVVSGGRPSSQSDLETKEEAQLTDDLVRQSTERGVGAIGEIGAGVGDDLTPVEKKMFRVLGRLQARTGLPIFTHNNYSARPVAQDMGLRQLDALEAGGANPAHLVIGHMCCLNDPTIEIFKRVAKRGAFVGFDRLTRQEHLVTDDQRVRMVLSMLDAGLTDNLLFSSDWTGFESTSNEIRTYTGPLHARTGGPSWARSIVLFLPKLRKAGVKEETLHRIMVDNPRRFLAFVPKNT